MEKVDLNHPHVSLSIEEQTEVRRQSSVDAIVESLDDVSMAIDAMLTVPFLGSYHRVILRGMEAIISQVRFNVRSL